MYTSRIIAFVLAFAAISCVSGLSLRANIDPSVELQQIFNGFWEQAGQNDPTTVLSCFTGNSPQLTVDFFANLTSALANSQYVKVPALVNDYKKSIPDTVVPCMTSNAEVIQVSKIYDTYQIKLVDLFAKVEKFVVGHVDEVHGDFNQLNMQLQAGNSYIYGRDAGALLLQIMSGSSVETI